MSDGNEVKITVAARWVAGERIPVTQAESDEILAEKGPAIRDYVERLYRERRAAADD